jgi:hypothetical protein
MPRTKKKQETALENQESQEQPQEKQEHREEREHHEFGEGQLFELLREDRVLSLDLYTLLSFRDVGLPAEAQRDLSQEHIDTLMGSDPLDWPPINVTKTSRGFVITDGNHRREVATKLGCTEIRAKCTTYHIINDVIEAAFSANLTHGLPASHKTRSDYAYWLHKTYPDMLQTEIAQRVHLKQPTVSTAISRREREERQRQEYEAHQRQSHEVAPVQQQAQDQRQQQRTPAAPTAESIKEQPVDHERAAAARERERVLKSCQSLVRQVLRFWQENQETDESQLVHGLLVAVSSDEEREQLSKVMSLLESSVRVGLKKPAGRRKW